jgi:adenosylmethionine-8-amino-7-oxononanoate aminotransferase
VFTEPFAGHLFEVARLPDPSGHAGGTATIAALDRLLAAGGGRDLAAVIVEPLLLGAGGMRVWDASILRAIRERTRAAGVLLIADEVLTGFGRTGVAADASPRPGLSSAMKQVSAETHVRSDAGLFACQREGVEPDFLALAKGLTGGYLPMAATLTTQGVFDAFLGDYSEFKTFFHGHSYTGNQLGAAAALASIKLLQTRESIRARQSLEQTFHDELKMLWDLPVIGDIRQVGLIVGIELAREWRTREPFDAREGAGIRVCEAMARRGVLTRPIGNVIVLIPPYCTTPKQARRMLLVLAEALQETFPTKCRGGGAKART